MKKNLAVLFAAAAMLAACGGDDGDSPAPAPAPTPAPAPAPTPAPAPAPASVPVSAAGTVNTWFDYLVALIATKSETAEPLVFTDGYTPPVSETESPRDVP